MDQPGFKSFGTPTTLTTYDLRLINTHDGNNDDGYGGSSGDAASPHMN